MDIINIRLKPLMVLVALVSLLAFFRLAPAAEFSADMIQKRGGMTTEGKAYIKGKKIRMEMEMGGGRAITIMNMETGVTWQLMPEQKIYMEMRGGFAKAGEAQWDEDLSKIADKKRVGTEKVSGYVCDKYEIIYHDKSMGKMTQWYSRKLEYPIKILYKGEVISEYRNIKEGGVKDSMFQIPPGYQKMQMPGMGRGMGRGMR